VLSWQQRSLDADVEELVFDRDDPDARALERMSTAAAQDDGYNGRLGERIAMRSCSTSPAARLARATRWTNRQNRGRGVGWT
jgi:hypothetical protein